MVTMPQYQISPEGEPIGHTGAIHPAKPTRPAGSAEPLRYGTAWGADHPPVGESRDAVRALLARAGRLPDHRPSQDAQLVVSELVTNAHRHAPGPGALEIEVDTHGAELVIRVRDGSARLPQRQQPDPSRVGGHGLHLVSRLCTSLRTTVVEDGKVVEARMHLGAPEDTDAR
ncbi:ATP-binding protein [Streptomyces sp. NPDC001941]|uniref:ATP-binding protein n=1 Tax=Streptomyces sp. NPDC001941 TaxID=3154659 RepID=UPI00332B7484